jgi:prolyl oligopeptidase
MTALLQSALPGGRPVLLHTSIAGNRSEFTALEQQIQDDADQLAFLWTETAQPSTHK